MDECAFAYERRRGLLAAAVWLLAVVALFWVAMPGSALARTRTFHLRTHVRINARSASIRSFGELDCNGYSTAQQSVATTMNCTDVRGIASVHNANTWGGRFYDNGHYIGHDEPDMTFLSSQSGSGNDVSWTETIPKDPTAPPTVKTPGADVAHWFELSPAPWFSMAMCDSNSYPLLPCDAKDDANAPACTGICNPHLYPGAGSAFMEMQFYPPGFAPQSDAIGCDNTHWCSALTIDSLECTFGFAQCNPACEEPVNFAFIQKDGIPTGPPSPQEQTLQSHQPNGQTLLYSPGDRITVHMFDAPVPGEPGQSAFEVVVRDLTTGQSGFMQASAANGFMNTSIVDCSGTPYNFEPEYSSAKRANIVPWAALQTDISTQFETGHWEACTSLSDPSVMPIANGTNDLFYSTCHGPYETTTTPDGGNNPELSDAPCYPAGDTHGVQHAPPDTLTGCVLFLTQNGDLDFEGTPYWPEWPVGAAPTAKFPGSFVQALPRTQSRQYPQFFIQTDLALSESTCATGTGPGCAVPPPNAPGHFYPYWSRVHKGGACTIEFGNVNAGPGVNDFGKDAGYGTNQFASQGYPEFWGPTRSNSCT